MASFKSLVSNKILSRRNTEEQSDKWNFLQLQQTPTQSTTKYTHIEPKSKSTQYDVGPYNKSSACSNKLTIRMRSKSIAGTSNKLRKASLRSKKHSLLATVDNDPDDVDNEIEEYMNLSITDLLCKKPRTHRFTSNLSMEGRLALIKTYEDMIFYELLVYTDLDVSQIPSQIQLIVNTEKNRQMNDSKYKSGYTNVINTNMGLDDFDIKLKQKFRFSHFIETAQMILDEIQAHKRERWNGSTSTDGSGEEAYLSQISKMKLNLIVNQFKKWIYLWNKESNLWNKELRPFKRF